MEESRRPLGVTSQNCILPYPFRVPSIEPVVVSDGNFTLPRMIPYCCQVVSRPLRLQVAVFGSPGPATMGFSLASPGSPGLLLPFGGLVD